MHHTSARSSRRAAFAAAIVALALTAFAAPANAADPTSTTACTAGGSFSQVFLRAPWYDLSQYSIAPGANFEGTLTGWTMAGRAKVVSGNETYYVGSKAHRRSLSLPDGSMATSAPMCVGVDYPWLRFFLRNTGASSGRLQFEVRTVSALGIVTSLLPVTLSGSSSWQLSPRLLLVDNATALTQSNGLTPVSFRFTPKGGSWQIDDVYVDPYRNR